MKIPLARPYFSSETIESIKKVLDSGWVTQGPKVKEFEEKYARYNGSKHAIAVSSGTASLHVSLLGLGIGRGDEVIVPDFTFPATGNAVHFTGAKPVLADINIETYCIDTEEIKRKITPETKALMPVHSFGYPADMGEIRDIAQENDLFVIEDAAQAHGAEFEGRKVGNFGVAGCFSFHPRKIISTGEGGMITTDDDDLAEKLRTLRSHGMTMVAPREDKNDFRAPSFDVLGYNFRMSDIHAAIGVNQLEQVEDFINKRRKLAGLYKNLIEDARLDVIIPREKHGRKHVYQSYIFRLKRRGERNKVITKLRDKGVGCTLGGYSLSSLPLFSGNCPNGEKAYNNTIALPLYYELKEKEVDYVVTTLKGILRIF